jgi:hypothetical protein
MLSCASASLSCRTPASRAARPLGIARRDSRAALVGALAALLLAAPGAGRAAEFCVRNGAELVAALAASENNGEDDVIKLAVGSYAHPQGFSAALGNHESLILVGGWTLQDGDCHLQLPRADLSVLDGQHQRPVLVFHTSPDGGDLVVSNLTIERGPHVAGVGGLGVYGSAEYPGNVLLERIAALDNRAIPIYIVSSGTIRVRGALVAENQYASTGIHLVQWGLADVSIVNSTVANNRSSSVGYDAVMVSKFEAAPLATVSNSILQGNSSGNGQRDLYSNPHSILFRNTLIQSSLYALNGTDLLNGQAASFMAPALGDYRLRPGSLGLDAGLDDPAGGLPLFDLYGTPRTVGLKPDLGAFETEHSFLDGFE